MPAHTVDRSDYIIATMKVFRHKAETEWVERCGKEIGAKVCQATVNLITRGKNKHIYLM